MALESFKGDCVDILGLEYETLPYAQCFYECY